MSDTSPLDDNEFPEIGKADDAPIVPGDGADLDATPSTNGCDLNATARPPVCLTTFISRRRLTKRYRKPKQAGGDLMTESGTRFSSGGYYVCKIPATGNSLAKVLEAIGTVLDSLTPYQAIGLGVPKNGTQQGNIVVKAKYKAGDTTTLARSLEHFSWPDLGLLFLDGDGIDGLFELVSGLYPPFAEVGALVRPSASASVVNPKTGERLKRGEHLYCVADDPSLSDTALKALMRLAWCHGKGKAAGWLMLSKRGDTLVRGPIDGCVGSPERLSYEGEVMSDAGVKRLARSSKVIGGGSMLCVRELVEFANINAPEDQYEAAIAAAKADPEFVERKLAAQIAYRGEHVAKAVKRGIPKEKAEKAYDDSIKAGSAVTGEGTWCPLTDEHVLIKTDGVTEFTVADIKADPSTFHGTECCDPIEGSDYQSHNPAIIYTDGPHIQIYSRAHGDAYAYAAPFDDEPLEEMLARITGASNARKAEAEAAAGAGAVASRKKARTLPELSAMLEAGRDSGKWYMPLVRALASMIGRGWNNDTIKLVVAPICKGNIDDAALDRLIKKARVKFSKPDEEAEEPNEDPDFDLNRLNLKHAVLPIGGKTRVVKFGELEEFPGRETIVMTQTPGDFALLNNKYRHFFVNKKGETDSIPMGTYWISHWKRRQYDGGMAFVPQIDGDVGDKLNLWRGFGVKPVKGDCSKFLGFARDIICSGNETDCGYLIRREALILQKRIRTEVALGLKTKEEGAGKGFYEKTLRRLYGDHAMQLQKAEHIIGKFNPHLETLLRVTADEALFVGDHNHRNALFGLITEPTLEIEPKGCNIYTVPSYLNISALSNSEHFLPVSGTSRRFFVPSVAISRLQDHAYFEALQVELDNGGYEALLHYLLYEVDLAGFNVRNIPQTTALRQQRDRSLPPFETWWAELLESGTLRGSDPRFPQAAVSNSYSRTVTVEIESRFGVGKNTQVRTFNQQGLYDQARTIEPRLRNYTSDHKLGAFLKEMGCDNSKKVLRRTGWWFPPLTKCRAGWEKAYPGWVWRNPQITEWQAEAHDFKDAEVVDLEEAEAKAAAEDATMREAIRAMKEQQDAKDAAKAAADQATIDGIMDGYETDLAKREQDFIGPRKPAQGKRPWQR